MKKALWRAAATAYRGLTRRRPLFPRRIGARPAGARAAVIASAEGAQLRASWHHQRFRRTARAAFDAELAKVEAEHTALRRELAAAYEELDRLRQSGAPQPSRAKGSIADFRIWVPSVAGISMLFQLPSPFVLPAVGTAKRWFPSPFSRAAVAPLRWTPICLSAPVH